MWVEVDVVGNNGKHRWVHLDPCEAAVDESLLYHGWGKKQTYILAFYAPGDNSHRTGDANGALPLVEDVTQSYTKDVWKKICKRREESEDEVKSAVKNATDKLRNELATKSVQNTAMNQ